MKTAMLAAASLTLLIAAPNARADHRTYRTLDDLAFSAMSDAREAHWEIHDHFDASRDYVPLLEDSGELMHALHDLQDALYREDRPYRLAQLLGAAHHAVTHFQEHVEHSDFARSSHGSFHFRSGGYSFQPATHHAGSVHVEELLGVLGHLDSHLHEMEETMERAFGHHDHHEPGIQPVVPPEPAFEGPELPPAPAVQPVTLPLLGGRFRIRID